MLFIKELYLRFVFKDIDELSECSPHGLGICWCDVIVSQRTSRARDWVIAITFGVHLFGVVFPTFSEMVRINYIWMQAVHKVNWKYENFVILPDRIKLVQTLTQINQSGCCLFVISEEILGNCHMSSCLFIVRMSLEDSILFCHINYKLVFFFSVILVVLFPPPP